MAEMYTSEEEFDEMEALSCQTESVQGYMFEPLRREKEEESIDDEETTSESESSEDERPERVDNNRW